MKVKSILQTESVLCFVYDDDDASEKWFCLFFYSVWFDLFLKP